MSRCVAQLLCVVWLAFGFSPSPAVAESTPSFQLAEHMEGRPVGRHLELFVEQGAPLSIQDIAAGRAGRFRRVDSDSPSLGFSDATHWLRLRVDNPDEVSRAFLIELAYPHLDQITLFVPHGDGTFEQRASGDALPFSERALPYRNVLFSLEQAPHSQVTYYLRVRSEGSLALPLRAWTPAAFFVAHSNESAVLWMFYGLMLVMGCYNLFLYAFVRQREYLLYSLYVFSMCLMSFTLQGHLFQYVLPAQPVMAGRMMPISVALLLACVVLFADSTLRLRETSHPVVVRLIRAYVPTSLALCVASFFLPYGVALRCATLLGLSLAVIGPSVVYMSARSGSRPAKIFLAAWACLIVGTLVHYLQLLGLVGGNFATRWGIQIGASAETLLLSVALADCINLLRAQVGAANQKLTENVADLRLALARAEHATRAKSEFLATMSHELRTPLNAIINIPQAIAQHFERVAAVQCSACSTRFELEPGEQLTGSEACPECRQGPLQPLLLANFVGDGSETLHHLAMVERAGKHLLQMVNGVLDFSKTEAGRLELKLEQVGLRHVLEEAVETLSQLATDSRVQLSLLPFDEEAQLCADALRVKQVLINLIGNAIKFSPPHSRVEVSALREPDTYVLAVRDHGIGIAPEDLGRVFRTFEQVDQSDTRKYGGTGLGLAISRSLVELHGGHIWVESELGKGSTFYVRLPRQGPLSTKHASEPQVREPANGNGDLQQLSA